MECQKLTLDVKKLLSTRRCFSIQFYFELLVGKFTQFPDIIQEAKADLENLRRVEAENNSSINLETQTNEQD